jgi:AcrR family transcriptional regulator
MQAKPASQQRSKDKRDRILKAMDTLLRLKPFAEIGVVELAAKASVSPATIYQRFRNVDATASVLLELYFTEVEEWSRRPRQTRSQPEPDLFEALVAIASDAYDQVVALGHIMRPAYLYSRQRPDRAGPEWARLERLAVEGFAAFLRERSVVTKAEDEDIDDVAARLCYLFNFMLLGPLLHGEDTHWKVLHNRTEFANSVATIAYRYLVPAD